MTSAGPSDEKAILRQQQHIPIPSYEEATGSDYGGDYGGESSSAPLLPPTNYRAPRADSIASDDSFLPSTSASPRSSASSLRREIVQMDMDDDDDPPPRRLLKHWPPFRWRIPDVVCCVSSTAMLPVYRLVLILLALVIVYAVFVSDALNWRSRIVADYLIPDRVRSYARDAVDAGKLVHSMQYLSSFDHVAGTKGDLTLAKYVERKFEAAGLNIESNEFEVYLNFPRAGGRRAWVEAGPVSWEARVEETVLDRDRENTAVFHGLAKAGLAKGPLIYANYGRREDFEKLKELGVEVKGAIVLVRQRGDAGLQVYAAEVRGAVGVLMFADPKTEGWEWPGDAVQRGAVGLRNWVVGDVLTPGYASTADAKRIPMNKANGLVGIPSLPLSWTDVRGLFHLLEGKGKAMEDDTWVGGIPDVAKYWTGTNETSPVVNLKNDQVEELRHPIWNVHGKILGRDIHEQKIIVGNHRDAWCFGASDPNSGTAVQLEVARILGDMLTFGWRPLRTIEFVNWDASEYNLIGSTEYVEDNIEDLRLNALAYINVASAVTGTHFEATGSPIFRSLIKDVLSRVPNPISNGTLDEVWNDAPLPGLGMKSDYAPFQHHAGVASLDITFTGKGIPVHSCYDSFNLIFDKDPMMMYHSAMAQILVLLILELSDVAIAPLNMTEYAAKLQRQTTSLEAWIKTTAAGKLDVAPLKTAVGKAAEYIRQFNAMDGEWMVTDEKGFYVLTDDWSVVLRRARTARMGNFEKHLLDLEDNGGVPGREWFKHMVTSPQAWSTDDEPAGFASVRDAVEDGKWDVAKRELEKAAVLIERAASKLLDESS